MRGDVVRPSAATRVYVESVRKNVTIDWTRRENVRADPRTIVKRILRKYGYPPEKEEKATRTWLEQAEALSAGWAAGVAPSLVPVASTPLDALVIPEQCSCCRRSFDYSLA